MNPPRISVKVEPLSNSLFRFENPGANAVNNKARIELEIGSASFFLSARLNISMITNIKRAKKPSVMLQFAPKKKRKDATKYEFLEIRKTPITKKHIGQKCTIEAAEKE